MEDIKVHGTYISDRKRAVRSQEIKEELALKLITRHTGIDTRDFNPNQFNFLNKGWLCLFFDASLQQVVVLYRHDSTWSTYCVSVRDLCEYAGDRDERYKRHDVLEWMKRHVRCDKPGYPAFTRKTGDPIFDAIERQQHELEHARDMHAFSPPEHTAMWRREIERLEYFGD
jgi:hypothetical protein